MRTSRLPTVTSAEFIHEVRPGAALPTLGAAEVAIAGRSNVGKSTLLNRLSGRRGLARTSKTPGRTRGIMFYDLALQGEGLVSPAALRLVDLPGYGYAQVSHDERKSWQPMIESYVEKRATLKIFLTLIDARRGLEPEEEQLAEWLATLEVPHRIVVTKVDKLNASARGTIENSLRRSLPPGPPPLLVSGETGEGLDRLWSVIVRAAGLAIPSGAVPDPSGGPSD